MTVWNEGKNFYPAITKEKLERLYLQEELSTIKIARKFGCSSETVANRLRDYGIPTRIDFRKWIIDCSASPELAYITGAILGDGTVDLSHGYTPRIRLAAKDLDFVLQFANYIRKIDKLENLPRIKYRQQQNWTGLYHATIHSEELYEFLKDFDAVKELAMQYPREFLKGFYDAEGSIVSGAIKFAQKKESNTALVAECLELIGIEPIIRVDKRGYYHVGIYRKDLRKKFMYEIGFSIKRKQKRLEEQFGGLENGKAFA